MSYKDIISISIHLLAPTLPPYYQLTWFSTKAQRLYSMDHIDLYINTILGYDSERRMNELGENEQEVSALI